MLSACVCQTIYVTNGSPKRTPDATQTEVMHTRLRNRLWFIVCIQCRSNSWKKTSTSECVRLGLVVTSLEFKKSPVNMACLATVEALKFYNRRNRFLVTVAVITENSTAIGEVLDKRKTCSIVPPYPTTVKYSEVSDDKIPVREKFCGRQTCNGVPAHTFTTIYFDLNKPLHPFTEPQRKRKSQ